MVGDLCDFWFASRQRRGLELACDGLRSLADYVRKGGDLWVLPGNHDNWLGPYYESALARDSFRKAGSNSRLVKPGSWRPTGISSERVVSGKR